ncbi:MAG TPA: hypothetical protein VFT12_01450 [Thermoanaerobaculia bacterium]|nr:hypothetical protein [Thermoanaerobaculia bacterium]
MKRATVLGLVLVIVSLGSSLAQDAPRPEWFLVYEEDVRPGATAEYETQVRSMIRAFNEKKLDSPHLRWQTFETDNSDYIFLSRLNEIADLPQYNAAWMNAMAALGPLSGTMRQSATRTTNSYASFLAMRRMDLSYVPAAPRLKPEEIGFIHHDFYYIVPGKELEVEQLAKDYAAALRKVDFADGFTVWMPMMGTDLPVIVVSTSARNEADWVATDERHLKALGAEGKALNDRIQATIRKTDSRNLRYRADLSRLP